MKSPPTSKSRPACPQCGSGIQTEQAVFDWPRINGVLHKVKIGTEPKINHFAPFCTLRCGWRWAKANFRRKK